MRFDSGTVFSRFFRDLDSRCSLLCVGALTLYTCLRDLVSRLAVSEDLASSACVLGLVPSHLSSGPWFLSDFESGTLLPMTFGTLLPISARDLDSREFYLLLVFISVPAPFLCFYFRPYPPSMHLFFVPTSFLPYLLSIPAVGATIRKPDHSACTYLPPDICSHSSGSHSFLIVNIPFLRPQFSLGMGDW